MPDEPQLDQLDRILGVVRDVLGPGVLGVYLYGSAVAGGLRPRSDVDILVVSTRRTTFEEKRRLVDGLVPVSRRQLRPPGFRPVELTLVVQSELRPWRYPPRLDFRYGEWLGEALERGDLAPESAIDADLAVLITMVLVGGRPLLGPPPGELVDRVPRGDLVRGMVAGIGPLLEDLEPDTTNVVLTLARIWMTMATGDIQSKDDAAEWALPRLPVEHRPVLARARDIYLGVHEDRWADLASGVRSHADHVVAEIGRLRRRHSADGPARR